MTQPVNNITVGEVYRLLQRVDRKLDLITTEVSSHERAIAVIQTKLDASTVTAGRWGAGFGDVIASIIAGLYYIFFN